MSVHSEPCRFFRNFKQRPELIECRDTLKGVLLLIRRINVGQSFRKNKQNVNENIIISHNYSIGHCHDQKQG